MDYLELAVAVRPEAVEAAADLLRSALGGRVGVSIEPPYEATGEDGGVALDERAPVRLRAWLPAGAESRSRLPLLRHQLRGIGDAVARPLRARTVSDASWADAWKRHFGVLRVGRRIVVRPSWRRYRARTGDAVIELDPGMAFGTGQHATTRMCLEALERLLEPGARVLDVGCGSGILAIAAALLGAKRVDAVDIDPAAVRATKENAARNGVGRAVRVAQGSLGEAWPFRRSPAGSYDLVLANLSSRLVQELAWPLVAALRPGGVAMASGLIEQHESACRRALGRAGGCLMETRRRQGWVLLVCARGTRRPGSSLAFGRRSAPAQLTARSPRRSRAPGRPRRRAR